MYSLPRTWVGEGSPQIDKGSCFLCVPVSLVPLEESRAAGRAGPSPVSHPLSSFQKALSTFTLKPVSETFPSTTFSVFHLGSISLWHIIGKTSETWRPGKGREACAGGWRPTGRGHGWDDCLWADTQLHPRGAPVGWLSG